LVNPAFGELYHTSGVNDVFDADGNLVSTSFIDRFGQLTDFSRGTLDPSRNAIVGTASHTQTWALDAEGNWRSVTTDGVTQDRTHNQQNQITSISGAITPEYDNNGNTTKDETGKTFVYDAWNRLVQVKDASSTLLAAYSYDGLNRRVVENHGTATDLYFSSDWQVLEEQVAGVTQAQYVWSPVYVDAIVERDRGAERLYVQQDANWNVTAIVDTSGNVAERYVYDPYGNVSVLAPDWSPRATSSFAWIYLYQGGRFDPATGLYDFRNREYSPTLGRWLQNDPIGFLGGTVDLYQMEGDNPTNATDPIGLKITVGGKAVDQASDKYQDWLKNAVYKEILEKLSNSKYTIDFASIADLELELKVRDAYIKCMKKICRISGEPGVGCRFGSRCTPREAGWNASGQYKGPEPAKALQDLVENSKTRFD
jgi:RHS repeat-associated protein